MYNYSLTFRLCSAVLVRPSLPPVPNRVLVLNDTSLDINRLPVPLALVTALGVADLRLGLLVGSPVLLVVVWRAWWL